MDHEIASSIASTNGDAHSATTAGEDTRKVVPANDDAKSMASERKYILPPSRTRPACSGKESAAEFSSFSPHAAACGEPIFSKWPHAAALF